eukprot:CAMPEP_0180196944 /NCGR_PEP_ID=MMETSP0987-20121128/4375_1 /TAXON_ID=697907 /ORGANISM="non described non described, Strain CCMP2293" /LENGTH=64 /DNA_ID=CAMNT_0022151855 /DNA_START=87 /DNA_END=278 /DNA_ORIENTATION=+
MIALRLLFSALLLGLISAALPAPTFALRALRGGGGGQNAGVDPKRLLHRNTLIRGGDGDYDDPD